MKIGKAIEKLAKDWLGREGVRAIYDAKTVELLIVMKVDQKRSGVEYPARFGGYKVVVEEGQGDFAMEGRSVRLEAAR